MNRKIKLINPEELFNYLISQSEPLMESVLIRHFYNLKSSSFSDSATLYHYHFSLYHSLYYMYHNYLDKNVYYLYSHFMRIRLLRYPEEGKCRYYREEEGKFCAEGNARGSRFYCDDHFLFEDEKDLEKASEKYFYLDPENYERFSYERIEKMLDSYSRNIYHCDEIIKAYQILNLTPGLSFDAVKNQFFVLARKFHPDLNAGDGDKFKRINNAYQLLKHVL